MRSARYIGKWLFLVPLMWCLIAPRCSDSGSLKLEATFIKGIAFWEEQDYLRALECFLKITEGSERKDLLKEIAELTGTAFQIKNIAKGRHPSFSPDGRRVAFASNTDGDWEIYIVNCEGKNLRQVTKNNASDIEPNFSPDGEQLVYVSDRDGNNELYIMDLAKSKEMRLTQSELNESSPLFSPDSKRIASECWKQGEASVHILDLETGNEIELRSERKYSFDPAFSPDGKKILFFGWNYDSPDEKGLIIISDIDGSNKIALHESWAANLPLSFSPDSKWVTVGSQEGIYLISIDGKIKKKISKKYDWNYTNPSFSSDGRRLTFTSRDKIRIIDLNTTQEYIVANFDFYLSWGVHFSPNGKRILLPANKIPTLFLVDLDKKKLVALDNDTPCGSREMKMRRGGFFSPDGKYILFVSNKNQICLMDVEPLRLITKDELSTRLKKLLSQEKLAEKKTEYTFKYMKIPIKELNEQIAQDNLTKHIQTLQDFGPRIPGTDTCRDAGKYIYENLASLGLNVKYDHYKHPKNKRFDSQNIIATLTGKANPELIYVIYGYYDSNPGGPGAWDGASGTAVALETARILSKHQFDTTIKFIFFSGHEFNEGLYVGSKLCARKAKDDGLDIRGILGSDPVGYCSDYKMDVMLIYSSEPLRNLLHSAPSYTNLQSYSFRSPFGDSGSFVRYYGDITLSIVDYPGQSPYFHTPEDVIDTLYMPHIAEVTKLYVTALAVMASSPCPVKGVKTERLEDGRLSISWKPNDENNIAGYRIYHGPYPQIFDQVMDLKNNTQLYLESIPKDIAYFITVKAYNRNGHESWGSEDVNINE